MELTFKQRRFALEYSKDHHAGNAAIRAGYSERSAVCQGSQLLDNPKVLAQVEEHEEDAAALAGLTKARVLREMMLIAFADPSELTRVRVVPCVNCWPANLIELCDGLPNPKCPTCSGHGQRSVWLADTSKVSPGARKLFLSAKQTKDGIEVKTLDRTQMILALARITGLAIDKVEMSGPGGGPLQLQAIMAVKEMTDEELMMRVLDGGTSGGTPLLP